MISHEHKCIFIHIPKTGGTSINSFFHPGVEFHYSKPDYERLFGWCPERKLHMQHATSRQLIETGLITEDVWNDYYKFTFVRDPWDRAYSDYKWIQEFSGVKGSFENYIKKEKEFSEILQDRSNDKYLGDHLIPQTDFFDISGPYQMDYVGRFENFRDDIHQVLMNLGIEKKFDIHQNQSKRSKNYSDFYDSERKQLVDKKYGKDISLLNYRYKINYKFWKNILRSKRA